MIYCFPSLDNIRINKSGCIKTAAQILLTKMEKRFPVTKSMVAAAILDPSIQHIAAIDEWLDEKMITRAQLIRDIIAEMNIELDFQSHDFQPEQPQQQNEPQKYGDIRLMLLQKHSVLNRENSSVENELKNFKNIREQIPDVLLFWKSQESNFPNIAKIAKVLLAIPATSAKSESCFSSAGALLCSRRAAIEPLRAEKILFIHDNFNFCANNLF